MNEQINTYIKNKREAGVSDQEIRTNLISAGWQPEMVDSALSGKINDAPPPPPPAPSQTAPASPPVAVVQTFTTRGLEYVIMFISLWVTATSIAFLLHNIVNTAFGNVDDYLDTAPIATASLIVALPIFTVLFIRLKKAEKENPEIMNDPSRKRAVQLTLVVTFIVGLWNIIWYLYSFLNAGNAVDTYAGSATSLNPVGDLIHTLISVGIAGSIFAYYWREEHRKVR